MISSGRGLQTLLSGPLTKTMTHYLRAHHQGILVGVGTAIADDPSLNCRYTSGGQVAQIQPLILDPNGRWDVPSSKAMRLAKQGEGLAPWVIAASTTASSVLHEDMGYKILLVGDDELTTDDNLGQTPDAKGRMKWRSILKALKAKGLHSVMIEGGATIIKDLLAEPELVDSVVITIAPTWLGDEGVSIAPASKVVEGRRVNVATLRDTRSRQFGEDVVICGHLER
jgi:2,5-diamino-6-(ribosylamino)-4(3H)-pyrimidinone 5'-phosphate reductase